MTHYGASEMMHDRIIMSGTLLQPLPGLMRTSRCDETKRASLLLDILCQRTSPFLHCVRIFKFRFAITIAQSLDWMRWDRVERCIVGMLLQYSNLSFLIRLSGKRQATSAMIKIAPTSQNTAPTIYASGGYKLIIAYFSSERKGASLFVYLIC